MGVGDVKREQHLDGIVGKVKVTLNPGVDMLKKEVEDADKNREGYEDLEPDRARKVTK